MTYETRVLLCGHSVKTPSYQGLKFLSDLLQLKETAILSDSDPDLGTSCDDSPINVLPCSGDSSYCFKLIILGVIKV